MKWFKAPAMLVYSPIIGWGVFGFGAVDRATDHLLYLGSAIQYIVATTVRIAPADRACAAGLRGGFALRLPSMSGRHWKNLIVPERNSVQCIGLGSACVNGGLLVGYRL